MERKRLIECDGWCKLLALIIILGHVSLCYLIPNNEPLFDDNIEYELWLCFYNILDIIKLVNLIILLCSGLVSTMIPH